MKERVINGVLRFRLAVQENLSSVGKISLMETGIFTLSAIHQMGILQAQISR